jgi:tetratricopeptide (TPR) repeat protein
MKYDYLLKEAEEALKDKNYNKASKKYEEYARKYEDEEPKKSAFHYKLAAKYTISKVDKVALYEKVAKLYNKENQHENQADIFMEIGLAYSEINNRIKATYFLKEAVKVYSKLIVLLVESDSYFDIENCLEKIKFCVNQIDGEK